MDASAGRSLGWPSTPATSGAQQQSWTRDPRGPGRQLGTHARAATAAEAAAAGDIVVVTIPLRAYREVPVAPLSGKVVIDTNNYYAQRDGHIAELDDQSTTSSELLRHTCRTRAS